MRVGSRRISAVTVLVGLVLLLVPALAWLQYQWLGQLSQAESERMQRTLRTAASQFAVEFDTELSKAMVGLQVEGPMLRTLNWTGYAQRYTAWVDGAGTPKLVREVLLVDTGASADVAPPAFGARPGPAHVHPPAPHEVSVAPLRVMRWNVSTLNFDPIDWPEDLSALRASMTEHLGDLQIERTRGPGGPGGPDRFRRDGNLSTVLSDDETLVNPITLYEPPADRQGPPRITVLGFTVIRLDPAVIRNTLLATLATRHLHGDDEGASDYRIAVVNREHPSTIVWESEPGAAKAIGSAPDVSQDFMAPRSDRMFVFTRNGDRRPGDVATGREVPPASPASPAPPALPALPAPIPAENIMVSVMERREPNGTRVITQGRAFSPFEGRWTLLAKHRAGSLEAAVAAVRTRNLMLSSGILLLLTTAVGLIVLSARRAQELARQQMEFVATVSHELRTPVSVIGAAASNLADGVVGDPQRVRKYGQTIQGEARRLAETVERVLQLAGIAAGRAAAAQATVHPVDLVDQSIQACRTEIEAAGVQVETEIADNLPLVQGDVAALRSAVQNLISNAVKYGGDARWVRIAAKGSGIGERGSVTSVVFTVEDRGLGIDADDRKHIFEPFYRGREAVSRQIHGSGLGLNLVQRIAEAHGGTVTVSSEPGKGSTFAVTLPAAPTFAVHSSEFKVVHAPSAR